jgi:hypothetical protein
MKLKLLLINSCKLIQKLFCVLIINIPVFSIGQTLPPTSNPTPDNGAWCEWVFFGRQPSARSEAMGRGYSTIDGDISTVFFNPAGIATIKGLEFNSSFASPYYKFNKGLYSFYTIGYKINNYLVAGLSYNHFSINETLKYTDQNGTSIQSLNPYSTIFSLTLSSQPLKNLYIGFNANYFDFNKMYPIGTTNDPIYFDFGIIKKIQFLLKPEISHSFNLGTSIGNFNNSKLRVNTMGNNETLEIPVIFKYGLNYQLKLNKHLVIKELQTLNILLHCEGQKLLNSQYHSAFRTGGEINILEIFSIRTGYFSEKVDDNGDPTVDNSKLKAFTYGLGLQLPLSKLTKIPLIIYFDYTSLPQPSYSNINTNWGNFTVINFRLNWIINNKN